VELVELVDVFADNELAGNKNVKNNNNATAIKIVSGYKCLEINMLSF
jgi:hypothetical protein